MVPIVFYRALGMWKSILSMMIDFDKCIRYQAHSRKKINFWNEAWCGITMLKQQFPALHLVDRNHRMQQALISENWFQRHLGCSETSYMVHLLYMLEKVFLSLRKDERLWCPDSKGDYKRYWNELVPSGVLVFCWQARLQRILTKDKLNRRQHNIVNGCPMCLAEEETPNH